MDKRKNNGGHPNSGRKPKAVELKAYERGLEAIVSQYGSEQEYWSMIAQKASDSFPHMKLLTEYTYGKAPEKIDITTKDEKITLSWFEATK